MIEYPKELDPIFNILKKHNAKPIIVGGFIRDNLLKIKSKDIDIEIYGISSFEKLENILKEFGSVNIVGKCFGVCKLNFNDLDLDFSLPRKDNKISSGHKGFEIEVDSTLDFKTASSRRDFTINAIGYDILEKKILDPFNGVIDLKNRILKAVDKTKFIQDPLRVLRAVEFYSRFDLVLDSKLFTLCENMVNKNLLNELPKSRIFGEIQKLILKSPKPSTGFKLLKKLHCFKYFKPIDSLSVKDLNQTLSYLDKIKQQRIDSPKLQTILSLAVLCNKFNSAQTTQFITNLSDEKELLKEVLILNKSNLKNSYTDSELYRLATKVTIESFLIYQELIHDSDREFDDLKQRAITLDILNKKVPPLLQGRDILALGIKPSKEFSKILSLAYELQINMEIKNHKEAIVWLKNYLAESK